MLDSKLLTFLKVVELHGCTAAAEALHLTQPAVTQHIRKLEEHYGCKLIDFSGRSLRLTPAGDTLFHYANLQLVNEQQLMARLSDISNPLHIGATLSIADYYLPPLLSRYLSVREQPFNVTVGNTETLLSMLLHGKLDCAFIEGIFDPRLFESRIFCAARFIPVVSPLHPLAGSNVTLPQLHDYPLVLREPGSGTRAVLENYLCQQSDSVYAFRQMLEMGSFGMIKQFLQTSDAISFMYEEVARREIEANQLCQLELQGFPIRRPLHFIHLKNSIQRDRYDTFFHDMLP